MLCGFGVSKVLPYGSPLIRTRPDRIGELVSVVITGVSAGISGNKKAPYPRAPVPSSTTIPLNVAFRFKIGAFACVVSTSSNKKLPANDPVVPAVNRVPLPGCTVIDTKPGFAPTTSTLAGCTPGTVADTKSNRISGNGAPPSLNLTSTLPSPGSVAPR
jgi:hypothetical protein